MAISTGALPHTLRGGLDSLNSRHHQLGLRVFVVIVVAHWAEHLVQAYQIYVLGWTIPEARGVLGIPFPWLVTSEWMHYGYALVMMVGLFLLLPGFAGRSGTWWKVSLGIQVWHHLEHLLLLVQALAGAHLPGKAAPTSLVQLIMPRVELHLFYNTLVTVPMVVAMYLHTRADRPDNATARCACAPKD
ncbi:hypothetical protein [Streptomyces griseomycini]|uniref:Uncharacterized protein n=1 Tax=Streptomyces griseomycini TaxID=66895 RepID=A0A7W7PV77_9ACTN|nr:hypothetical protein [Streptomyces griseomycini]MBB4901894.1 hypothetical protein [Streptomyces griseomycini]GGQ17470.1 hypothetical protein GCM10010266_45710 [Streptomyces griseomycini]GGR41062.1 hypothetical protein GCM10015536_53520 [Streptomyces griseomycini]